MKNNNWLIKIFPSYIDLFIPTKEEMEKLLPPICSSGWEEIERYSGEGSLWIKIGHRSPNPKRSREEDLNVHLLPDMNSIFPSKSEYDFTADLRVTFIKPSMSHLSNIEELKEISNKELIEAQRLLEENKDKISKEELASIKELMEQVSQIVSMSKDVRYLGEKARAIGNAITSVSVGNFILDRSLIGSNNYLKPGKTPVHSNACYTARKYHTKPGPSRLVTHGSRVVKHINPACKCNYCKSHPECSTLKTEGFIHREIVESLLLEIFSKIKSIELPKKEFQKILTEIVEIEKELQSAGVEILEKSAEELYRYDRENIERLFELKQKGPPIEFLKALKSEYFTMLYQVRANQSVREKPPKKYEGYVFLGRSIVKKAKTWAIHIQKLKLSKPEDLTNIMGGVKAERGIGKDTFIADTYKKIGEL